jgi:hypothetical protein
MFFPFFDWTMVLLIPAIILSLYAQFKVKSTFNKYSNVSAQNRITGAQVAQDLVRRNGMSVNVERVEGQLTDHYDPRQRVLRLSSSVHDSYSLAALGVAAHEMGHAIQHEEGYFPLGFRNTLVPVANFGSTLAMPLLLIGLLMGSMGLARIGVFAFTAVVLFQLITLPVEFNASSRAITLLTAGGYITQEEIRPTKAVLNAAALTYVAAALVAFLNLVRLLIITGFFPWRR